MENLAHETASVRQSSVVSELRASCVSTLRRHRPTRFRIGHDRFRWLLESAGQSRFSLAPRVASGRPISTSDRQADLRSCGPGCDMKLAFLASIWVRNEIRLRAQGYPSESEAAAPSGARGDRYLTCQTPVRNPRSVTSTDHSSNSSKLQAVGHQTDASWQMGLRAEVGFTSANYACHVTSEDGATACGKKTAKLASVWITSLISAGCVHDTEGMLLCADFVRDQGRLNDARSDVAVSAAGVVVLCCQRSWC